MTKTNVRTILSPVRRLPCFAIDDLNPKFVFFSPVRTAAVDAELCSSTSTTPSSPSTAARRSAATARIEQLKPVAGAATLRVELWVNDLDDYTCTYGFLVSSENGRVPYARGERTVVNIDPRTRDGAATSAHAHDGAAEGLARVRMKGERTRHEHPRARRRLASLEGLEGLTIGRLADELGMSKSGLFAHFGSKEELQLATIEAASQRYIREIFTPALREPRGYPRLVAICESWLSYIRRGVFPGGCFFAAASFEFDSRPGPVQRAHPRV